jgi:hypothetical protein
VWHKGIAQAWRDLRAGYEAGAAAGIAKALGAVVGSVHGLATQLDGAHFTR